MKAAELCAGYGGLALAVEQVFGAETAWFSEFEAAPSKILAHHWPDVPNHGDMTKIDWSAVEPVDIISGGTPCQDLSHAGRRQGMTDGTRSNLWVQMRESIAVIKPTYVVWENVRGAYSASADSDLEHCEGCMGGAGDGGLVLRALGRVLGDLSDLGFDVEWRGLRASDVGAPHGRFRVFVLATHRDNPGRGEQRRTFPVQPKHTTTKHEGPDASDTDDQRGDGRGQRSEQDRRGQPANSHIPLAVPSGVGGREGRTEHARIEGRPDAAVNGDAPVTDSHSTSGEALSRRPGAGDTGRLESVEYRREDSESTNWGEYAPAIRRWERTLGRRAPRPTEPTGRNGGHRLSARFAEFLMGCPDGWIVDVPGVSRNEALKAAGNGVVTAQAVAALQDMLGWDTP